MRVDFQVEEQGVVAPIDEGRSVPAVVVSEVGANAGDDAPGGATLRLAACGVTAHATATRHRQRVSLRGLADRLGQGGIACGAGAVAHLVE